MSLLLLLVGYSAEEAEVISKGTKMLWAPGRRLFSPEERTHQPNRETFSPHERVQQPNRRIF